MGGEGSKTYYGNRWLSGQGLRSSRPCPRPQSVYYEERRICNSLYHAGQDAGILLLLILSLSVGHRRHAQYGERPPGPVSRLGGYGYRASCSDTALTLSKASFRLRLAHKRPIRVVATAAEFTSRAGWKFMGLWYGLFDAATIGTVNARDEIDSACVGHVNVLLSGKIRRIGSKSQSRCLSHAA